MAVVERNTAALWLSGQTAKGAPATTAVKKGRLVSGAVNPAITYGSENYADGSRFSSSTDFVDTISGEGNAVLQGQSGLLAYLAYLMLGQEAVTGVGPYVHVATPGSVSKWVTVWSTVGASIAQRRRHSDCRITQLVFEGSTSAKVVHVNPTFRVLDPGEVVDTDPVKTDDGTDPILYTEATGTYTVDGVVIPIHSGFSVTIADELTEVQGDGTRAVELAPGRGTVGLEVTLGAYNEQAVAQMNKIWYGNATPAAGTKPQSVVPALGTYEFNATRGAAEAFKVKFFGVRWAPPAAPTGDPGGGAEAMTLSGGGRLVGSNPMVEITVTNSDAAYTV